MLAGFASLQPVENAVLPSCLSGAGVDWILELAPAVSPSPGLELPRHRLLLATEGWVYPFRAPCKELPLADDSIPALMLRHLFQPGVPAGMLDEALRCLMPGGLLVTVSANPWHPAAWHELGRGALRLPPWPWLQLAHARRQLRMEKPARGDRGGSISGLNPLLVVVARKPPRPAQVRRLKFRRPALAGRNAAVSQCEAA